MACRGIWAALKGFRGLW